MDYATLCLDPTRTVNVKPNNEGKTDQFEYYTPI